MRFKFEVEFCAVTVVDFCSCQGLTLQQLSTPKDFVMFNLNEFLEERQVDPLVPNQIPNVVEIY